MKIENKLNAIMLNEQIKYIKEKSLMIKKKIIIKWVVCVTFGFLYKHYVFSSSINFLSPSLSEKIYGNETNIYMKNFLREKIVKIAREY